VPEFDSEVLAARCAVRYARCIVLGEPLNQFGRGGGRDASFESHFLVEKIMGIDIRLPVGSGLSLLGLILAACGILAALSYSARCLGVAIFNFRPEIFLLTLGLVPFLLGRFMMRFGPQKSLSWKLSDY
jgi:hypothetical protein